MPAVTAYEPITISPNNDYTLTLALTTPSLVAADRGRQVPDTGLTGLIAFVSASSGASPTAVGAAVDNLAMVELTGTGIYQTTLPGSAILSALAVAPWLDANVPLYVYVKKGSALQADAELRVTSQRTLARLA